MSSSKGDIDYWDYLEENYREVADWPEWKRGAQRCEPEGASPEGPGAEGAPEGHPGQSLT